MGRFFANFMETGTSLYLDGKFPDIENIPIARKFNVKPKEWLYKSRAYEILDRAENHRLNKKEIDSFHQMVTLAEKSGNISLDTKEEMIEQLEENIKYTSAPKEEVDVVAKIGDFQKKLRRKEVTEDDIINTMIPLIDEAWDMDYITKRKYKMLNKLIDNYLEALE